MPITSWRHNQLQKFPTAFFFLFSSSTKIGHFASSSFSNFALKFLEVSSRFGAFSLKGIMWTRLMIKARRPRLSMQIQLATFSQRLQAVSQSVVPCLLASGTIFLVIAPNVSVCLWKEGESFYYLSFPLRFLFYSFIWKWFWNDLFF